MKKILTSIIICLIAQNLFASSNTPANSASLSKKSQFAIQSAKNRAKQIREKNYKKSVIATPTAVIATITAEIATETALIATPTATIKNTYIKNGSTYYKSNSKEHQSNVFGTEGEGLDSNPGKNPFAQQSNNTTVSGRKK